VTAGRGNNLHEVLTPNGDKYLVSMPSKYRKSVWIKRGLNFIYYFIILLINNFELNFELI
jgi:hypothetical protein